MTDPALEERIQAVRGFNRFYTQCIGVLHEGYLKSPFSLAEARVLWELAHRDGLAASDLAADLGLDPGYLSRILKSFEKRGLLGRKRVVEDRRRSALTLTKKGRAAFAPLDAQSRADIAGLLEGLDAGCQAGLIGAMQTIQRVLATQDATPPGGYRLRPHEPGDMGWVVQEHAVLYSREYHWNADFEAMVATLVARFLRRFDPERERCWIAEKDGERVGSVFLVRRSETRAQLRMLIVDPKARGLGIGNRLVNECLSFARQVGYRKVVLWTNDILHAARRIYEKAGFERVRCERHRSFGHDLVGETWELRL
jgi:DNA-binding MarR family transcriptional regulator/GNAT superfamily N-acetyltransferase